MDQARLDRLNAIARYMGMGALDAGHDIDRISHSNGAIAFCREDPAVARAVAALYKKGLIGWILLTGGIGKDSGELSRAAGSEAAHQRNLLIRDHRIPAEVIHVETEAKNGAENSRLGIEMIECLALAHERITLVMPPRYARRVYGVHTKIAREEKGFEAEYQLACFHDPFNPNDPAHRKELLLEFLRVADWPAKGWADPQPDLPQDLVAWARKAIAS